MEGHLNIVLCNLSLMTRKLRLGKLLDLERLLRVATSTLLLLMVFLLCFMCLFLSVLLHHLWTNGKENMDALEDDYFLPESWSLSVYSMWDTAISCSALF